MLQVKKIEFCYLSVIRILLLKSIEFWTIGFAFKVCVACVRRPPGRACTAGHEGNGSGGGAGVLLMRCNGTSSLLPYSVSRVVGVV